MERSEQIDQLAAALAEFNAEVENPAADKSAKIEHKTGGSHTITYGDLAGITSATRAPLAKNGLSIVAEAHERDGMIGVGTTLMHSSGQWITFEPVWIPGGNEAKDIGGAVTYSRRYGLATALNIAPEKDGDAPNTRRPQPPTRETTEEEYATVETKWRTKGKPDSFISTLLARGGHTGPLWLMPRSAYDFLMRDLDKLPDVADPVSGEVVEETAALAGETFDGTDEIPGMGAEQFAAARERQAQEQDDDRMC